MDTLLINGVEYEAPEDEYRSLLTFLLEDLGRTDQKFSCRGGICGICMLKVDGRWTKSCITPARWMIGKNIQTQGELIRIKREEKARAEAEAAREAAAEGNESAPEDAAPDSSGGGEQETG